MYKLNNKHYYKYLSWVDIYFVFKYDRLNTDTIKNYILFLIQENKIDIELVIDFFEDKFLYKQDIIILLENILNNDISIINAEFEDDICVNSHDKIRHILLIERYDLFIYDYNNIKNNNKSKYELLDKFNGYVEEIYSSFDIW